MLTNTSEELPGTALSAQGHRRLANIPGYESIVTKIGESPKSFARLTSTKLIQLRFNFVLHTVKRFAINTVSGAGGLGLQ